MALKKIYMMGLLGCAVASYAMDEKGSLKPKKDPAEESEVGPEKQLRAMLNRLREDQERPDTKIRTGSNSNACKIGRDDSLSDEIYAKL